MGYQGIPILRDSCGKRTPQLSGTFIHCVWWNLQFFKVGDLEGSQHYHYISRLGVGITELLSVGNHSYLKKGIPQTWKSSDLKSRMRRKEKKEQLMPASSFSTLTTIRLFIILIFTFFFSFLKGSVLNLNSTCIIFL